MNDEHDEHNDLLDNDPALDFILYQEMEKQRSQPKASSGCFGIALLFILPIGIFYIFSLLVA